MEKYKAGLTLKIKIQTQLNTQWIKGIQNLMHFATVTHSLCHLLKKGVEFNITEERAKAWEKVKKMLTEAPCLLQPDLAKPFILYVDASFFGLGAALHQK